MKKILSLLIAVLFTASCTLYSQAIEDSRDEFRDEYYSELVTGHEVYFGTDEQNAEWMKFETVPEVSAWVVKNIKYVEDASEEFSNPEVVLERGYGDCDDFALLIMNIIYVRFDIKTDLILLDAYINPSTESRVIIEGGSINHATIGYNGQVFYLYDLRICYIEPIVGYAFSFDYTFPYQYNKIDKSTLM